MRLQSYSNYYDEDDFPYAIDDMDGCLYEDDDDCEQVPHVCAHDGEPFGDDGKCPNCGETKERQGWPPPSTPTRVSPTAGRAASC